MKIAHYPPGPITSEGLEALVEEYVLADYIPPVKFVGPGSIIRTQGSCFAANLAAALQRMKLEVRYAEVKETINSPLTNRMLMASMMAAARGDHSSVDAADGAEKLLVQIREESVFILTLGVACSWFEKATGNPSVDVDTHKLRSYEQRLSSVAENVDHITFIVNSLRSLNPTIKVVLTVSPVPLKADFTHGSAVVADFLSKATLRLAAEEYLKTAPADVYYWPAFEIVRWLGAHLPPVFGADDGMIRHVNRNLVDLIVGLFIKHFALPDAVTAAQP